MIVTAVKTAKVQPGKISLESLLDKSIRDLSEGSIVTVTSKVVALCENRVVRVGEVDKQKLVEQEADQFIPSNLSKYGFSFTLLHNTLIPSSGIDESNGDGNYVLWPSDPQASANRIRQYLKTKFGLKKLGVMITDSTAYPLRYGTVNIVIGHSGFLATHDYRGQPDLFGRKMEVSISSVAGALAAAAGAVMGEGTEQTPIVIISDVPFVKFQDRDPTKAELENFYIPIVKDDLFAPFLQSVNWQKGGRSKR